MICGGGGGSGSSTGGGAGGTTGFGLTTRRFGFAGRGAFASDAGSAATTADDGSSASAASPSLGGGWNEFSTIGTGACCGNRLHAESAESAQTATSGATDRARNRARQPASRTASVMAIRDGNSDGIRDSSPRAEKPRREKPPVITKAPCFRAACLVQIAAGEPGRIDM